MKKYLASLIVVILMASGNIFCQEEYQEIELPVLSLEQKYKNAEGNLLAYTSMNIAFAKSKGLSVEEYGKIIGKQAAQGWRASNYPLRIFMIGMNRNMQSFDGFQMEILEQSESSVKARYNRDWEAFVIRMEVFGSTLAEFQSYFEQVWIEIGKKIGVEYVQEIKEDWIYVTVTKK